MLGMPLSFLTSPTPNFSSRGIARPPPKFVPNPPAPAPPPRASVASHPPPPVFTPVPAPPPPPAPASVPVIDPQPLGFSTGFSPHIETFKSIGESYFLTDSEVQADVSRWAIYPAVQTVVMDGNAIEGASDIGTSTLSATQSIGSPVLNLIRGPGGVPGKINMRDNNGVNHVLESVNSNLYFDDELLAKAGDIQDIADWALYAAIANVDMDNNSIVNCGSITNIPGATIDNSEGTIKVLNLDLGPDDASRIRFTNEFGASKDLKLEVGGGEHLQWGGENVVTGDVVTSLDGITGDIVLQAGPGILIGPGIGPQNISISAPTIGEAADPPGPATAYGQANQAILDAAEASAEAAEALAAAEAAQATADAAAAEAAAATAAIGVVEGEVVALQGEVAALTVDVGLIQAAYVTKVGLEGNQRSGEITLKPGANTTITEAPNGTFTFASTAGGGVTSLNTQAGALTLTSANANIVVGSTGAGNIELTAALPFDLNGLLNKINAFPTQPYTSASASTPAANQVPTAIVPDGSFPVNVPTVGSVQGGWGFSKAVGSAAFFNWYMYNPRFSNPAAALPYIKSRVQSVWALIRPTVNLYSAGYLALNIYSYDPANPPTSGFYNTRWAYSNSVGAVAGASGTNLFAGYTYLIYANDSPRITNTSAIGVPDSQVSTLRDPYDIYTDVNHIPLQNCVVAFNPWTNGTNYKTWTAAATFALNDTVVFAGSGVNFNGLFFRSLSVNNNNHPPMTNGVVDTNWALIDPQPSSYADQPILAINLNQATASAQAVGYVVLDIGFSYGPSTTSTTVSEHISLNPN